MLNSGRLKSCPHPSPASTAKAAKSMNTETIPSEYQTFSSKALARFSPACSMNDMSFSPMTGSTQGITLRISPPRNPIAMKVAISHAEVWVSFSSAVNWSPTIRSAAATVVNGRQGSFSGVRPVPGAPPPGSEPAAGSGGTADSGVCPGPGGAASATSTPGPSLASKG